MAAGGDVSQIVLQMPNAAAQLVIDPLFRRSVHFFKGGVRGDVSGVSSVPRISSGSRSRLERTRRGKHEIANKSKKQIKRKLTLEWYASLVGYCPP
jgi:stalled ribosome alternative rescue factor ArfA